MRRNEEKEGGEEEEEIRVDGRRRTWRAFHWSVSEMSAGDAMGAAAEEGPGGIEVEDKLILITQEKEKE
jgi:hypothetical protein